MIDYARSSGQVFVDATVALLHDTKNLYCLAIRGVLESTKTTGLPSWVPNWSGQLRTTRTGRGCGTMIMWPWERHDASRGLSPLFRHFEPSLLEVRSAKMDSIASVSEPGNSTPKSHLRAIATARSWGATGGGHVAHVHQRDA